MKPYGLEYAVEGCVCSLCRSRGYRKGNAYDSSKVVTKHRARQQGKRQVREDLAA
ncbi:hypothetical protein NF539_005045 [Escherichia coli]|nr:hypothetical protein [Escherichia coli]EJH8717794.1 hypothetical protein [Escherichia coli]